MRTALLNQVIFWRETIKRQRTPTMRSIHPILLLLILTLLAHPASAMFAPPAKAPVDRLVQNISAYIKEHPDDAQGYYTLARVHFLALALKQETLGVYEQGQKLPSIPDFVNRRSPKPDDAKMDEKQLLTHLTASMENFATAISKAPGIPLFHLGVASLLESAIDSGLALPPIPGYKADVEVKDWKPVYLAQSIRQYLIAYDQAINDDLKLTNQPVMGLSSLISYEAGTHYLQLARRDDVDKDLKGRVDVVTESVKALQSKPSGPVTPIVFSLKDGRALNDLLAPGKTAKFDLDGTGRGQTWPWLKPDTGILVWDPSESGRITSGRQLFGSVSWWIFWRDGYAAMDALDDNRDGRLSGSELIGLAVWFDRNGNGISDPGEVVPLASVGVESIEVRATARDGASPMNAMGLRMKDGRILPTWDWTVNPVETSRH